MTDFKALEMIRPALDEIKRHEPMTTAEAIGRLLLKVSGHNPEMLAKIFSHAMAEIKTTTNTLKS